MKEGAPPPPPRVSPTILVLVTNYIYLQQNIIQPAVGKGYNAQFTVIVKKTRQRSRLY